MSDDAPPSSAPWFPMRPLPAEGDAASLPRDEAKHATGSRRLSPGDEVVLFDGRGGVAVARLGSTRSRDGALAVTVGRRLECRPPVPAVTIATAVPKGDRWGTLLDMAGQLGAARIVPIDCERSVVRAGQVRRDRSERILVEACKQSRRPWCPELAASSTPVEIVREAARARAAVGTGSWIAVAHPGGAAMERLHHGIERCAAITVVVGPEGGFTEREVDACRAEGAAIASLGDSILRIETACVVALAILRSGGPAQEWSVPGSNR